MRIVNTVSLVATSCMCSTATSLRFASRNLAEDKIAGYQPLNSVVDYNAFDLDCDEFFSQLALSADESDASFAAALRVYEEGGNSGSFAILTLSSPTQDTLPVDATVTGVSTSGNAVTGTIYEAALANSSSVQVLYSSPLSCQVGGLPTPNIGGCFAQEGSITIGASVLPYSYNLNSDNKNLRTLQSFSTSASTMFSVGGVGSYYPDFKKFVDYYGVPNFGDILVNTALKRTNVTLNGVEFDFSTYSLSAVNEYTAKITSYMIVALASIGKLEKSLEKCSAGSNDVFHLDQAVAYFAGSLEGVDGSGSGVLMHALAEKRCENFKTCGVNGTDLEGNAKVNFEITNKFTEMQANLVKMDCGAARTNKEEVVKKFLVPIVQGALRYSYRQSLPEANEVWEAENAAFMTAILPVIADCSPSDAAIIYKLMKPNSGLPMDFPAIKKAFESTYSCLGITCEDVGGLYNTSGVYINGAEPCNYVSPTSAPVNSTSGNSGKKKKCFSGHTMVEVQGFGSKRMDSLKIGDSVLVENNSYSKVYSFGHYSPNAQETFLQINGGLEITSNHMIYANGKLIRASEIKVGDVLNNQNVVESVKTVIGTGLFAPFTHTGKIVVNGAIASNYITQNTLELLGFSYEFQHEIQHFAIAPYRFYCSLFGCSSEKYNEEGYSMMVAMWLAIASFFENKNWILKNMPAFLVFIVGFYTYMKNNKVVYTEKTHKA